MAFRDILYIGLDEIEIGGERRPVDDAAVRKLAKSIKSIGLQHPITVRSDAGRFKLVAGRHRLEAYRLNGEDAIPASVVRMDKIDAEMWEISENLHRADLTELERGHQINRWRELMAEKVRKNSAPVAGGAQPNEMGIRKVAEELGIDEKSVRNAAKIDNLSDDAKAFALGAGLDDHQTALLEAARQTTAADQIASLQARVLAVKPAPEPLNDIESAEKQLAALMSAWNRATREVREEFLLRIDRPVMDGRYA